MDKPSKPQRDLAIVAAIDRVLAAEHEAELAIAAAQRRAEERVERARALRRALLERTQGRVTRLHAGERGLAVHPGCGTNLATTTLLPATFAWVPLQSTRSLRWRLLLIPLALVFAAFGYLLSKPLGPWLQANITTEADLGNMQVTDIVVVRKGVHRVITK